MPKAGKTNGPFMRVVTGTLLAGIAASAAFAGAAQAQGLSPDYTAAFEARVANPNNTSILGTFIDIAVREGQYDQALSTTEQHLIAHPRDAKARLIAGRLYNHLGSYELARRQVNHALEIGTLSSEETKQAQDLLRRIERALSGWTGSIAVTGGVRSEWIDFSDGSDRDDVSPFGRISGTLRQDLKNATRDAIIYSGVIEGTRRFFDVDLSSTTGEQDHFRGRAAITWDKGLPDSGIDSLRMLLSGYVRGESFDSDTDETEYGGSLRFTARPTVDSFVYAGVSYGWLDGSQSVLADERFNWEAGFSHRLTGTLSAGVAVKGSQDYDSGDKIGEATQVEASIGGVVYSIPGRLVWTHKLGVAFGERESPDLSLGLPAMVNTDFWQISSQHDFQLSEKQYISFGLTYTETDYDNGTALDRDTLEAVLSYTHIFN